jgi:hypothetical protein
MRTPGARDSVGLIASSPRRRIASDDDGNLMLLAGILITIAFILTALTLAQVASLERAAAAEPTSSIATEWRFLHDRIPNNVNVSIASDTRNDTFLNVTFPAIAETFRSVEASKGYDVELRLGGNGTSVFANERSFTTGLQGAFKDPTYSVDGRVNYGKLQMAPYNGAALPWDNVGDGLIWGACPDGTSGGCAIGVVVYVHLSDGASTIEETMVVPANGVVS